MFKLVPSRLAARAAAGAAALAAGLMVFGLATGPASAAPTATAAAAHTAVAHAATAQAAPGTVAHPATAHLTTAQAASGAAAADPTWNVSNSNADGSFTAVLDPNETVIFTDTSVSPPTVFTCTASNVTGVAASGTNLMNPIATFSATFNNCTGPLGSTGTAVATGQLWAEAPTTGTPDTVNGYIVVTSATLTINSILGTCTATITAGGNVGMANNGVSYTNSTGLLEIPIGTPSTLTIATIDNAVTCAGLLNPGDNATFSASYDVTDPMPPGLTIEPFTG